jgi:serine/threonine protein phosphatase PrpC
MTFRAAGLTDAGCQRAVNEDRFHVDPDRGIFIVVDGVGGQAAGGRAADTALDVVRARLATANGAVAHRMRDAITMANNEIHRQAASRAEWNGMACVMTAVVVDGDRAVFGHVGDTRLYKIRGDKLQKLTSDHSPVGEREDAGEISELAAMQHPRRNEVYRDVGSEPHDLDDTDFVDVRATTLEPDAALLLCSDGLTDLVPSDRIQEIVRKSAGRPEQVTRALVQAANDAGGKDNVTVIYVEGDAFAKGPRESFSGERETWGSENASRSARKTTPGVVFLAVFLAVAGIGVGWWAAGSVIRQALSELLAPGPASAEVVVVRAGESIAAALERAAPGATVLVEPGEYRERLTVTGRRRLISLVPRAATLRLPGDATDADTAVTISGTTGAEISGFRIVGDAATPLGTGVLVRSPNVRVIDVEIVGAARAAVDIGPGDNVMVLASHIHDNPGSGLALRSGATPRVAYIIFKANGTSTQSAGPLLIEPGVKPVFSDNTHGDGRAAGPSGGRATPTPTATPNSRGRGRQ